jgi:hypothetical protein
MSTTELRLARERLGLSLRDVADRTRIRVAILDAIENQDAERLPPAIFTRGFVKAYAREVGLDPQTTAAHYAALVAPSTAPGDHVLPDVGLTDSLSERDSSSLVTAALIVAAGLVFVLINPWTPSPPSADKDASATAVATTGETRATRPGVPRTPNMRIDLAPRGPCWIEATADGDLVIYKLLNAGDRYAIEGYEDLVLKVGDPSALVYAINGTQGRPLGPAGRPATVHMTRENIGEFAEDFPYVPQPLGPPFPKVT